MSQPVLSVRALSKKFGALLVAQSIDLELHHGARMGLIGPNGAGKTTFVNMLTGVLSPDSGSVSLNGTAIDRLNANQRVRAGVVRTHQINALLGEETALQNVALAIAERKGYGWRFLRYTKAWRECLEEAAERLAGLGIGDTAGLTVSELPYGKQRLLEIAIALALEPKVLLLDEPAAGVPAMQSHTIHDAVDRLPSDVAVLMIEHDMDLVFRFAQEIVVLVGGAVLTRGTPREIAANVDVQAVYLGRGIE